MKAKLLLPTVGILCLCLAACGSNSSSGSSASPSASTMSTAAMCTEVDKTLTKDLPDTPTNEQIKKAVADLNAISAKSDSAAQAVLAPLISSLQALEGVDISGTNPPVEYQQFVSQAQAFQGQCAKAGVTLTPSSAANPGP